MIRLIRFQYYLFRLLGLFFLIKNRIYRSSDILILKVEKIVFPLYLRISSSDVQTFKQVFVNHEYDFQVKKQPESIVDAGANIGLASVYFANKYPETKIVAIEPEEGNFEILVKNVAGYKNVTPIRAALWHKNEMISVVDPGNGSWGFITEKVDSQNHMERSQVPLVQGVTLEKIIDDYDIHHIDILKVDIEGSEREVFTDTSAWIKKVDSIIIELHENIKTGCNRSFHRGSRGFENEWHFRENVYLSRSKNLIKPQEESPTTVLQNWWIVSKCH